MAQALVSDAAAANSARGPGWRWLLAGAGLYFAANWLILGPLMGSSDTFAFKDAGASLALGQGFTTAWNFGNPSGERLLYAGYPPAYAFLAGVWFWLAGVSVEANSWFEVLLRVALAGALWCALAPVVRAGEGWLLAVLLVLGLPSGMTGLGFDRPDALALILAIAALVPFARRATLAGAAGAALLAGATLLASPLAACLATAGIALQWLLAARSRPGLLAMALVGLAGLLLPLGLTVALLSLVDPTYGGRLATFLVEGGGGLSGTGAVGASFAALLLQDPSLMLQRFLASFTTAHHWVNLVVLLAMALVLAGAILRAPLPGAWRRAAALLMLGGLLFLTLIVFGWSRLYPVVTALYLVPLYASVLPRAASRAPSWPLLALGVGLLLSAPLTALGLAQQTTLQPSLERMRDWLAGHPLQDVNGDGRVLVALDPSIHLLLREFGYDTLVWGQPTVSEAEILAHSDAFAFGFNGTGDPLRANYPTWWNAGAARLLYHPALPQIPRLFGQPLARSSKTWEADIWEAGRVRD